MLGAGDLKEHVTDRKTRCRSRGRLPRGPREPGERRAGPAHTLAGSRAKAPSRVVTFQVQVSLHCSLCCHEQSFTLCTFRPFPGRHLTRYQCRPSATNACSESLVPGDRCRWLRCPRAQEGRSSSLVLRASCLLPSAPRETPAACLPHGFQLPWESVGLMDPQNHLCPLSPPSLGRRSRQRMAFRGAKGLSQGMSAASWGRPLGALMQ